MEEKTYPLDGTKKIIIKEAKVIPLKEEKRPSGFAVSGPVQNEFKGKENTRVSDKGLILLVDYYEATVATAGGDCYRESVLWLRSEDEYEIHTYDSADHHYAYKADKSCYEEVKKYLEENGILKLTDYKGVSPTGKTEVIRFFDGKKTVRLTLDNMDEKHFHSLNDVGLILSKAIKEENAI